MHSNVTVAWPLSANEQSADHGQPSSASATATDTDSALALKPHRGGGTAGTEALARGQGRRLC